MDSGRPRVGVALLCCALGSGCYDGFQGGGGDGGESATDGNPSGADGTAGDSGEGETDGDTPPPVMCGGMALDPGPNLARRLTVREYVNTVRAVMGVDLEPEARDLLPAELRADGFTNTTSGLITTLAHVEAYDALAELSVQRLPDLDAFVGQYTSCQEFELSCETEFVENFGRKAFRRPLNEDERDLLVSVFPSAQDEQESFAVGAGLVVEAMLQSPPFLYRLEDETAGGDGARPVNGYEMASRLSYLIWAGPPDDALMEAAADTLRSDGELEAQVDRMLATPEARAASAAFISDWLHLSRLNGLPRDPEQFPEWTTGIADGMAQETLAYFEAIAWDDERAMVDLFNAQQAMLTPELATYYLSLIHI